MTKLNKILFLFLLITLVGTTACDNDFQELNTPVNTASRVDDQFLLTWVWTQPSGNRFTEWRSNIITASGWTQHFANGFEFDNYNTVVREDITGALASRMTDVMPEAQFVITNSPNTIVGGMVLVFKVFFMQRMADMHGEIPYREAFRPEEFRDPRFQTVSEVYEDFVSDLRLAKEWLANGQGENPGTFDPIYAGDIDKWNRFINSLILRMGIRLTEVDMVRATALVNEALDPANGGVMTSNDDIAWINHSGTDLVEVNASGIGGLFTDLGIAVHQIRFSDVFVNQMSNTNDPRQRALMGTYDPTNAAGEPVMDGVLRTDEPSQQIGLRVGEYQNVMGNGGNIFDFAQPKREVVSRAQPALLMTYAEVEFNKSEAFLRGMATGDPRVSYEEGVRAAIRQLTLLPGIEEFSEDAIDTFLSEDGVRYDSGDPMVLINTQKWVSLLFNGYEAWANQRRIDIPELIPVDASSRAAESDGTLPKRVRYPENLISVSEEQSQIAIDRQGPNDINTRLWWDVR